MPIYDIFEAKEKEETVEEPEQIQSASSERYEEENLNQVSYTNRDRVFTSVAARLFFISLFIVDLFWIAYSTAQLIVSTVATVITLHKVSFIRERAVKSWISFRRSLVCGLALFVTLFNPAFGIMIACTYFLMYDKNAVEEIVPASLQPQFKEFFSN
ncbi:MAG TPA: hypothetical protein VLG49_05545 [Rhabdochlamydiaceae bacterium]|nr:hypothetical protein [Rhabdochlamydiaceae bacterium]